MYHVWWFVFLNASFQPANMAHKLWYKVKADIKSLKKTLFFLNFIMQLKMQSREYEGKKWSLPRVCLRHSFSPSLLGIQLAIKPWENAANGMLLGVGEECKT